MLEIDKLTENYLYRLICNNCLNNEDVEIKFGLSVESFRKTYTCKKCGVKN
ncbi:hypothetical protein [Nitrososphaeria virus YSH_462411]|uniref:Uncharacterized protein n=1 Tax=Nitrososphaeria virus YSH_462411 TaxID=3071321 RepID=A0A976UAH6_9CAUD|nr:hypothetical protein QKV92_gp39 [Yangshan Harbor Nitrososphaeria virus]UVF62311.1 hypothetical protein [Nitrososphaeria virus YSH_462411]